MIEDLTVLIIKRDEFQRLLDKYTNQFLAIHKKTATTISQLDETKFKAVRDDLEKSIKQMKQESLNLFPMTILYELLYLVYEKRIRENLFGDIGKDLFEFEFESGKSRIQELSEMLGEFSAHNETLYRILKAFIDKGVIDTIVLYDIQTTPSPQKRVKKGVYSALDFFVKEGKISPSMEPSEVQRFVFRYLNEHGYRNYRRETVNKYIERYWRERGKQPSKSAKKKG